MIILMQRCFIDSLPQAAKEAVGGEWLAVQIGGGGLFRKGYEAGMASFQHDPQLAQRRVSGLRCGTGAATGDHGAERGRDLECGAGEERYDIVLDAGQVTELPGQRIGATRD